GFVDPPLVCDVGEPRVEQREVRAGINRKVHDPILTGLNFACVHSHRASRIDNDYAAWLDWFSAELDLLLVDRRPAQIWNPVIEEVVGLSLQCVCTYRDDRVGKLSVLV